MMFITRTSRCSDPCTELAGLGPGHRLDRPARAWNDPVHKATDVTHIPNKLGESERSAAGDRQLISNGLHY